MLFSFVKNFFLFFGEISFECFLESDNHSKTNESAEFGSMMIFARIN